VQFEFWAPTLPKCGSIFSDATASEVTTEGGIEMRLLLLYYYEGFVKLVSVGHGTIRLSLSRYLARHNWRLSKIWPCRGLPIQLSIICWSQQLPVSAWSAPVPPKLYGKRKRITKHQSLILIQFHCMQNQWRLGDYQNRDHPLTLIDVPAYTKDRIEIMAGKLVVRNNISFNPAKTKLFIFCLVCMYEH